MIRITIDNMNVTNLITTMETKTLQDREELWHNVINPLLKHYGGDRAGHSLMLSFIQNKCLTEIELEHNGY